MTKELSYFPGEWHLQSGIQLTWPDSETDWKDILEEVIPVYEKIAQEIIVREKLLVVCRNRKLLPAFLLEKNDRILIHESPINDTWARDHGALSIFENGNPSLLNFRFNGWGMKFPANYDNQINTRLQKTKLFQKDILWKDWSYFTLEGGSIETNGNGVILTTEECLLSPNRNEHLSKSEVEFMLQQALHAKKVLWLKNGFLEGDDTDSHIDTLARFCNENTIAYIKCDDPEDKHYESLKNMETELKQLTDQNDQQFNLVPLPFPKAIVDENGNRLPATYANFLILNKAVLLPVYMDEKDSVAIETLEKIFPDREIIPIDSRPLIKQHGSIHCISMQFPEGIL
ncbi:agmatine deiminase family protein [Sunxiuqinia sp. A32]|uniref:agmatine deiminase family protein n=1 Tax=Sunxiuqinia sp. A32 TaxID=3461496 RepID=UPI00404641C1